VQLTEHGPVQVTWHVEPPVQETTLLSPTVTVHADELPQSMLHDRLQLPEQSFSLLQSRMQLAEPPQVLWEKSHEDPAEQVQLVRVQYGRFEPSTPQPTAKLNDMQTKNTDIVRVDTRTGRADREPPLTPGTSSSHPRKTPRWSCAARAHSSAARVERDQTK
jgi:hypothetical protein